MIFKKNKFYYSFNPQLITHMRYTIKTKRLSIYFINDHTLHLSREDFNDKSDLRKMFEELDKEISELNKTPVKSTKKLLITK